MKFIILSVGGGLVVDCGVIAAVASPTSPPCGNMIGAGVVCEISLVSITKYLIDFIIKTKVVLPQT
jgi:hypothetical protein